MAADLLAFFIALFASLMLVVPVRALALRVGMVDLPGPRKVHLKPIPLLGGLAMYAAVVIAVLFASSGPAGTQIEIGRAHVLTPVTPCYLVCRLLLEKKKHTPSLNSHLFLHNITTIIKTKTTPN